MLRAAALKLHAKRQNADAFSWYLHGVTKFLVKKVPALWQSSRPEFPRTVVILANCCYYVFFIWTSATSPGPESFTKQDYELNDVWKAILIHFAALSWHNESKGNKKTAKGSDQSSVISNLHISSVQKKVLGRSWVRKNSVRVLQQSGWLLFSLASRQRGQAAN